MKTVRIILLAPLALVRLLLVLAITAVIGIAGSMRLKISGFSRSLQKWVLQTWGKTILRVCGIRVSVQGNIRESEFILMPNHRSYIDIFIVAACVPSTFVAKAELKNWPMMKTAARITNMIFVSRSELKSLVGTMNKMKQSLNMGIPVTVFPEGTSFRGPLTKPFKNGSFKIAADGNIPIIPAAIHFEDENDAWVDDDTFVGHFFRQMSKPVTRVHLQLGVPVMNKDYQRLKETTRQQIDNMLQEIQSSLSGGK